jgi:hypothetical protein
MKRDIIELLIAAEFATFANRATHDRGDARPSPDAARAEATAVKPNFKLTSTLAAAA